MPSVPTPATKERPADVSEDLLTALYEERGNVRAAARRLGMSQTTLYKRLDKDPRVQQAAEEAGISPREWLQRLREA